MSWRGEATHGRARTTVAGDAQGAEPAWLSDQRGHRAESRPHDRHEEAYRLCAVGATGGGGIRGDARGTYRRPSAAQGLLDHTARRAVLLRTVAPSARRRGAATCRR